MITEEAIQKLSDKLTKLEQENIKLTATVARLQADVAGQIITGPGFSGNGPRGISFDARAALAAATAGSAVGSGGAASDGEWYSLTLCDDTEIFVWKQV